MSAAKLLLWAVILLVAFGGQAMATPVSQAAAPESAKAQVMIVGVAHLVARNDVHNSQFTDSPLSPKRQAQIADIIGRLVHFHPTKVLIEGAMENPVFAQRYSRYLNGTYALPANETFQFGFKLAKLAGNSTIYPIDTFGPTLLKSDSKIDAFLKSNFTSVNDTPADRAFIARSNALERNGTYLDLLRYLTPTTRSMRTRRSIACSTGWGVTPTMPGAPTYPNGMHETATSSRTF